MKKCWSPFSNISVCGLPSIKLRSTLNGFFTTAGQRENLHTHVPCHIYSIANDQPCIKHVALLPFFMANLFHSALSLVNSVLGKVARRESWKLRRLVSVFNRMAKRSHYPRERGIRRIYQDSGIPLPTDPRFLDLKILQLQHINTEETPQVAIVSNANFPFFAKVLHRSWNLKTRPRVRVKRRAKKSVTPG